MFNSGYRIVVTREDGTEFQITFGDFKTAEQTWRQLISDTTNVFRCQCYRLFFGRELLRIHRLV